MFLLICYNFGVKIVELLVFTKANTHSYFHPFKFRKDLKSSLLWRFCGIFTIYEMQEENNQVKNSRYLKSDEYNVC